MFNKIKPLVSEIKDDLLRWRRHFHKHPELGYQERNTVEYIKEELLSLPNISVKQLTPTSLFASIKGAKAGKKIALRADIDALPIKEENDEPFCSVNEGIMHACGHDAHTAMLMGAAKLISKLSDTLKGEVSFIFQHAEELQPGGAKELVKAGVLNKAQMIFGLHVNPHRPFGSINYNEGIYCASADNFNIEIRGKGAHGAYPHFSIDPIVIGSQIVNALQTIVSRRIDPFLAPVVTIATFKAEGAYNIIPETALLKGTWRSHDEKVREEVPKLIAKTAENIGAIYGAECKFNRVVGGFPVGINGEKALDVVKKVYEEYLSKDYDLYKEPKPMFGAEDFSYYQQKIPGAFLFLGLGGGADLHTPHFKLNEDVMPIGVSIYLSLLHHLLGFEI
ncbi:MAG: amidohydrolase [Elusimicrobiota bacterium]|jgi:amidohydrolase|nr:amidohydrolase [Elusimicrobiota bacterium]